MRLPDPHRWLLSHAELHDLTERRRTYEEFETPHALERLSNFTVVPTDRKVHATARSALPGSITTHGGDSWHTWAVQKVKEAEYDGDDIRRAEFLFAWWRKRTGKN